MKRIVRILLRNGFPINQFARETNSSFRDLHFGNVLHCRHTPLCGFCVTTTNLNIHNSR